MKTKASIYVMLVPNLLLFLSLSIYPIIWSLRYAFYDYDGVYQPKFVGFDNFVQLITKDHVFWDSLQITGIYVLGKLLIVIPLAFLVALALNIRFRGNGILQAIVFSPTIMSSAVMAMMFYLLLNVYNGEVNRYLQMFGIIHAPVEWLGNKFAMFSVLMVALWGGLGNYMVYFLAGLQTIPKDVYESAELDGVTFWKRMFYITLPMLGPVLRIILMLAIVSAFQDIQSILVLTGGGPLAKTKVVFLYIYQLFFPIDPSSAFHASIGYGAAASMVTGLILGMITLVFLYISRKLDKIY